MAEINNLSAVAETVGSVRGAGISVLFNNFIIAAFIIAFGFFIGNFLGKLLSKILRELEFDKLVKKVTKRNVPGEQIISYLLSFVLYIIAIVLALKRLGIAENIFKWIAIVVIALILISFALSIRDLIPNLVAGIRIITRKQIRPGDHLKADNIEGDVIKTDLLEVRLKNEKGDLIYIPTATIAKSKLEIRKKL